MAKSKPRKKAQIGRAIAPGLDHKTPEESRDQSNARSGEDFGALRHVPSKKDSA